MMRLIDADALIDEVKYITGQDTIMWFDDKRIKRKQAVNMAAFIELMPTIDPVKRGYWELVDGTEPRRYGCSECKRLSYTQNNYCSYCGTKMDGEE